MIERAIAAEKDGNVAVFYINKEKSSKLFPVQWLQLPKLRDSLHDYTHNIANDNSPVKQHGGIEKRSLADATSGDIPFSQTSKTLIGTASFENNIPQTSEKGNKQTRFSLCERDAAGEQVRFGQREKDELRARLNTAINRTAPSGEMIYARETPPIFVDIGLQPYPMTMGQGHIRKGTIDIKDASHALGINGLIDAIDGLNDPIAIIASETHPLDN